MGRGGVGVGAWACGGRAGGRGAVEVMPPMLPLSGQEEEVGGGLIGVRSVGRCSQGRMIGEEWHLHGNLPENAG